MEQTLGVTFKLETSDLLLEQNQYLQHSQMSSASVVQIF